MDKGLTSTSYEQIAKTAHAVHKAYCDEMEIPTQPCWDDVDQGHKDVVIDSVMKIMEGHITSAEISHINFVTMKLSQGWIYGEAYSRELKTNPRLVTFGNLSKEQRIKEALFFECVNSFK